MMCAFAMTVGKGQDSVAQTAGRILVAAIFER